MSDSENEYIEVKETVEKPKRPLTEKQKESLAKGRAKKQELIKQDQEAKTNKKLEERFDRLVAMFEKVKLPEPEVQEKIKKKRAAPPPPPESDDEEEPEPPKRVEKPRKPTVVVRPDRNIVLSFV